MIKDILNSNEEVHANSKQLAVLKEHFPACFTADGSFDIERFKSEIADKSNVLQEGWPYYIKKVESKGRTIQELFQVIEWLTGFDEKILKDLIDEKVTIETFFQRATLNPNAHLITGVICGYRVEEIENPVTRQARYLDKLIDELAKGKKMEKILRRL